MKYIALHLIKVTICIVIVSLTLKTSDKNGHILVRKVRRKSIVDETLRKVIIVHKLCIVPESRYVSFKASKYYCVL